MIIQKNFIVLLLLGSMLLLSGCSENGNVSLEEALMAAGSSDALQTEESSVSGERIEETSAAVFYVYVCGAVSEPGVYALEPDCRIVAAVEAAGGFLPDAATEAVNLAEPIRDGMQIVVPDLEETLSRQESLFRQESGLINLNTATVTELCTLNGIGEAKAEAILAYREEIGAFGSVEQLKEVTGIGESLFHQIKSSIYIE